MKIENIGPYSVINELGSGGNGTVYKVEKDGKEYLAVSKNCQIQLFNKKGYTREKIKSNIYCVFC